MLTAFAVTVLLCSLPLWFGIALASSDEISVDAHARSGEEGLGRWTDRIALSGTVETAAYYEYVDAAGPATGDTDTSDIALSKVEVGVDVEVSEHISGHLLFLWEQDDTEPVDLDEGYISIAGGDALPLYLNVGKMAIPFGVFESHFISDPLTLELGETKSAAIQAGLRASGYELLLAIYNGDADETGEDDHIASYAVGASIQMSSETWAGFGFSLGGAYISNLADSGTLSDDIADNVGSLNGQIGGLNLSASISFGDSVRLIAEYVGALSSFDPGELSFDGGTAREPKTWNLELGYDLSESLTFAVKYEGGDDLGDLLPNRQLGCVLTYGLFEGVTFALEFLNGEFENNDERRVITSVIELVW